MKSFFLLISLSIFLFLPVFLFAAVEDNPGVSDSWLNTAMENIERKEYRPSLQELDYRGESFTHPKFHLANRANNLRAYFDENGMELIPRVVSDEGKWSLKIKSIEVTDGKDEKIFSDLDVAINGNNIVCTGDGIEIFYSNSENGIRQSISIQEGVEAERVDFIIEVEGLDIDAEKDKFILNSGEQEIIYQIKGIKGSNDQELSYSLSEEEGNLNISLDDKSIVYPVKITANITSNNSPLGSENISPSSKGRGLSEVPDWTAESDQEYALFGNSVSGAGDVNGDGYSDVIVGAYQYDNGQAEEGVVFLYLGDSGGLSSSPSSIVELNLAGIGFGQSVSTAGDVNGDGYSDVIVGAPSYAHELPYEGAAFVYHGGSDGLSGSPSWSVESDMEEANFGYSVSTAGDVNGDGYSDVIVGAPGYNNGQAGEGASFVYHGSSGGLSGSPSWTAESDQQYASFGSVSGAGDVNGDGYSDVIVGAPGYDDGGSFFEKDGRAFVYHGSSGGLSGSPSWSVESDLEEANFGNSVSGAGDVNGDGYSDVIVGAYLYANGQMDEGAAFVYYGSSSGLDSTASWTAESDSAGANFGKSVSGAGDINGDGYSDVIVGAPYYANGQTDEGGAFVYHGSSSGLDSTASWTAESDQAEAQFGWSVSSAGDVNGDGYSDVVVGALFYENGQTDEGGAFVFHGSSSGLDSIIVWTAESNQASANFGYKVSPAGDVNGDGYSDIIVGADMYDNGQTDEGRTYLYHGSSSGLDSTADWTAESNQAYAHFAQSVSSAGDVNGDGYSDVIVGANYYDNGETDEGRVFVYHGSSSGLDSTASWTVESNQVSAYFGQSVSSAGDVNGDGYSDVIVGAHYYDNGQTDEGRAYLYHGSSSGLSTSPDWTAESNQADARFGYSVSSAGDVNGDGYSDVIVGVDGYDNGEINEGGAFVYHGSSSGFSSSADWTAESNQAEALFGQSVSSAGDVNGDGYSDVIVGAHYYDNGQTDEGRAYLYHGSSSGLSSSADWTAESNQADAYFGYSVSSAGDVNGDGYSDVIVGADGYDNGEINEGGAFVYHGSSSGFSSSADWTAESNQAYALFGQSVSSAGDVNGDGYSDVIVGAHYYDNGQTDEGGAFVYHGNGNGLSLIPTQSKEDGSLPVQLGNATGSGGVQLNILGRTPGGRGKVKLQWEVKELRELFDGTSISESNSWYDTDTNGIEISEDVTGLSEATAYHWRVRLKYDPVTYNDAVHSRWLSIGPNGWNEKDFITTALSGIKDNPGEISSLQLSIFPAVSTNIFSIRFSVSEEEAEEDISLKVYNKAGIMVKSLFKGKKPAGIHTITLNGDKLPNDIYFVSLKKGKKEQLVRKVVLLR
jgi:hypothetical protein